MLERKENDNAKLRLRIITRPLASPKPRTKPSQALKKVSTPFAVARKRKQKDATNFCDHQSKSVPNVRINKEANSSKPKKSKNKTEALLICGENLIFKANEPTTSILPRSDSMNDPNTVPNNPKKDAMVKLSCPKKQKNIPQDPQLERSC